MAKSLIMLTLMLNGSDHPHTWKRISQHIQLVRVISTWSLVVFCSSHFLHDRARTADIAENTSLSLYNEIPQV